MKIAAARVMVLVKFHEIVADFRSDRRSGATLPDREMTEEQRVDDRVGGTANTV